MPGSRNKLSLLAAIACLSVENASAEKQYVRPTDMKALDSASFNMRYVPEDEEVEFIVTMPSADVWFGIALGSDGDMTEGTDMVLFVADGEQSASGDYVSEGYRDPRVDM